MMKTGIAARGRRLAARMCLAALPWVGGCEDCCEEDYHHHPPPGLGSLVVDNDTDNDISVFFDGAFMDVVAREDHKTAYDLVPGLYRVVLEERGGDRHFRGDIDILPDRLTVIFVSGYYTYDYYIDVFFR